MKKMIVLLVVITGFLPYHGLTQSPQKMSYQAIVRDASNNLIQEEQVGVRISILKDSPGGVVSYDESHTPQTNENGMFTIEIGNGTILSGNFSSIEWNEADYWLKTEIDPDGGTNYSISATSQLLSVPYSFHADHSAYADSTGKSIHQVTDNGDTTLTFHFSDGSSYITPVLNSFQGQQGNQGVSIVNTYIQNDSLIVELSNGQNLNAGYLNFPGQNINLCTVNTIGVSDITPNTAKVSFIVPDAGNELLLAQGVCYSQSPNPTVAGPKVGGGSALNTQISLMISSLTPGESYYARPFATNVKGTNYGQEISFTAAASCLDPGTYPGTLDYNLNALPLTIVYSGSVPATLTVNSDFSVSFSFTDPSIPIACNSGITFTGNLSCSNPPFTSPGLLFDSGTTGACSYLYSHSPGSNDLDPYISFFLGGAVGSPLQISDANNTYGIIGLFTFN